MIDLNKLIQWLLIAFSAGSIVLITHLLTVDMMFTSFQSLNNEIHSNTIERETSDFPIPRGTSLDSLAFCIMKIQAMEENFK